MELPSSVQIKEVSISTIYKDGEAEKLLVALKHLASHKKDLKVEVKRYFSTDYEIFINTMKKDEKWCDSPIMFFRCSTTPLVIVNQKYIIKPKHLYEFMYRNYEYQDNTFMCIYGRKALTEYVRYFQENKRYEYVYMDFLINTERLSAPQRVIFALDLENAPKTCKNFIELIKGEHNGPDGQKLAYKGTKIHKVWNNGFIQGGDVENKGGKGGHSIYGKYFEDENYVLKHDQPGVLGMASDGKRHTNNSQFYVTLTPLPTYDHKFVVFGKVVEGFRVIKLINKLPSYGSKPQYEIKIHDCGLYRFDLQKVEMKKKGRRML